MMGVLVLLCHLVLLSSIPSVCPSRPSCPATDDGYDADVLILGAGMAGITAAKTLHEAGVNSILILEARDRIGGRMRSENFGGMRVEIGANWVQSVDKTNTIRNHTNPIWELAQRCGLKGNYSDFWHSIVVYDGSSKAVRAAWEAEYEYYAANEQIMRVSRARKRAGLRDISVRQALTQQGWNASVSPVHRFVDWFNVDYGLGEDVETTSLFRTHPEPSDEMFGEDEFFVTDERGYEHLVHCLASDFNLTTSGRDSRLRLNTTVTDIYWSDVCVCVKAINGGTTTSDLCAKHAIITFSIGVLKNTKGIPFFHPALPEHKTNAIAKIGVTHMLKIYLKFNHSFWDQVEYIGQARGKYHLLQPIESLHGSFPLPHNTGLLLVTVVGEDADRVLQQPVEVTRREIAQQLREMYKIKDHIEPVDILVPTWKNDPLYMGTYSNTPVGLSSETYRQLAAPVGNLYFSGEAVSEKFHSYVHGAHIAAIDTARELVHQLKHSIPKTEQMNAK